MKELYLPPEITIEEICYQAVRTDVFGASAFTPPAVDPDDHDNIGGDLDDLF